MAVLAVFINVTLNLILIKKFGITGAAIANAATQLFTAAYQIILAKKIFHLRTDFSFLLRMAVFIILIAAGSLLISKTDVFWVYSFSFYVILALLLSFALGLMKIKSFYGILSTE
jgi:O-antigen/teichoic acid export membrane protein